MQFSKSTNRTATIDRSGLALITLFAGGLCLGVSPFIVKTVDLAPEVSAFYRVLLAAPAFAAFAYFLPPARTSGREAARPPMKLYALTAALFAADVAVMHISIRMTNVAVATLLTNCAPFFVGLAGLVGLSDRPTRSFWLALPLALLGIVLLIGLSSLSGGSLAGNLLALVAAAFYGGYLVGVRELRARGAAPAFLMVWVTAGSAVLLIPLFVMAGAPVPTDPRTWMLLAILILIGQVVGQGLVTLALRDLPASLSSLVLLIQPLVAAALSWVFLSETLTLLQAGGMAIVLTAIALATMGSRK